MATPVVRQSLFVKDKSSTEYQSFVKQTPNASQIYLQAQKQNSKNTYKNHRSQLRLWVAPQGLLFYSDF